MVGNRHRVVALGAILCSAIALFSAGPVLAGPNGTAGGPTPDRILGSGSRTTQILMLHLDGLYNVSEGCLATAPSPVLDLSCQAPDPKGTIVSENYEHDIISEASFVGSSNGINQLCTQGNPGTTYIDFARSSRGPKATDCRGLHFVAYARDGISVEASDTAVPLSGIHAMNNKDPLCTGLGWCITQFQLKGIYVNCTIKNWNDGTAAGVNSTNLGGNASTIQVYTPQAGSDTRSQFETFLGISDSSVCITVDGQPIAHAQVPADENAGIAAADVPHFIFPFSFAIFDTEVNPTNTVTSFSSFLLAAIDGFAVSLTTIANGNFPYGQFAYNVFCTDPSTSACGGIHSYFVTQKTVDYIGEEGWICKPGTNENAAWVGNGNFPPLDTTQPDAQAPHVTSLHYQVNWSSLISKKITSRGFAPLPIAEIGGGDAHSDHCRLLTT
jgi:ABC-type phosphate transport system substrate-binding protein